MSLFFKGVNVLMLQIEKNLPKEINFKSLSLSLSFHFTLLHLFSVTHMLGWVSELAFGGSYS